MREDAELKATAKKFGISPRELEISRRAMHSDANHRRIARGKWDRQVFRTRIKTRAKELNKPLGELLASQGLTSSSIFRTRKHGPLMMTLQRIANALELRLGEVCEAGYLNKSRGLCPLMYPELLLPVYTSVRSCLAEQDPEFWDVVLPIYEVMAERYLKRLPIDLRVIDDCRNAALAARHDPQANTPVMLSRHRPRDHKKEGEI